MDDAWAMQWYREDVKITDTDLENFGTAAYAESKIEQLLYEWKVLAWGAAMPRRLGNGATAPQLAKDKKFFRKAIHVQRQAVKDWTPLCPGFVMPTGNPTEFNADHKKLGAQLIPEAWLATKAVMVEEQRAKIITIALKLGLKQWAGRAANAFNQELAGLDRVAKWLRD